jgi:hypothetical protein
VHSGRVVLFARSIGAVTNRPSSIAPLNDALKFIFSWVALMPLSVIVSGKLLAHIPAFRLAGQEKQDFGLRLPGVIRFFASGDEVVFGFGLFLSELFILSLVAGHGIYKLFRSDFGVNLGQFNSLCAFSALSSVVFSLLILIVALIVTRVRRASDKSLKEYDETIDKLTRGRASGS